MALEVLTPFPGCTIVKTSEGNIQFGSPSDIIKLLQKENIEVPSKIVLPDDFFAFGINQASIEFPLYYFLFVKKGFFEEKKFEVIGTPDQLKRTADILNLTLLGPTLKQMKSWKISDAARIRKELDFMAIKKPGNNEIARIEDIIEPIPFKDEKAGLGNVSITKTGHNIFQVEDSDGSSAEIDINLTEKQPPPLPINPPERKVFGGVLAMRAINTRSGFDPHGYTTGFIMWVNGVMVSIDGVSWMQDHLLTHGISQEKLTHYILTHIHDDHSSIVDQIVSSKKINIITAKPVFESFIHKLASILDWDVSKVRKLVNFIEAISGKTQKIFGADFDFWYTLHSIPTIGFKVSIQDKSYIFTGDMAYGPMLEEAYKEQIISKEKYELQKNIPYLSDVTKIFFDGGGGEIHPDPGKMNDIGKNVIFFHTGDIGDDMTHVATIAKAGTTWISIPSKQLFIDDFTAFSTSPLFKEASLQWQRVLLNSASQEVFNEGDLVIKEGEQGGDFCLVLAGTFFVYSDNEVIAYLQEGDFFGEAALIFNKLRNTTIKAVTPGGILRFPGDLFYEYASETGIDRSLHKIQKTKPLILKLALFQDLNSSTSNWISQVAETKKFEKGEVIIHEGTPGTHFYVIESGKVKVDKRIGKENIPIADLGKGHFVGEMGILGPVRKTSATVTATSTVKVLSFGKEHLKKLTDSTPYLNLTIGKVMEQRFQENKQTEKFYKSEKK
jgi:CRP-like cAMP-binding protein